MSIGVDANKSKIGALLVYLCSKIEPEVRIKKLLKLVFLIDERSVIENGFPITWLDYFAWEKGPVAKEIYNIKDGQGVFANYFRVKHNDENKVVLTLVEGIDVNDEILEFSDNELSLIDSIIEEYRDTDGNILSEITHKNGSLWKDAFDNNNLQFIEGKSDYILDLRKLISGNKYLLDVYEDAFNSIQFQASIK